MNMMEILSKDGTKIFLVEKNPVIIYRVDVEKIETETLASMYYKIVSGPSGTIGKYINTAMHPPISIGKFNQQGYFIDHTEALQFQKECLYKVKNNLDTKIADVNKAIDEANNKDKFNATTTLLKVFRLGTMEDPPTEREVLNLQNKLDKLFTLTETNSILTTQEPKDWVKLAHEYFKWRPLEMDGKIAYYQKDALNSMLDTNDKYFLMRKGRQVGGTELITLAISLLIVEGRKCKVLVLTNLEGSQLHKERIDNFIQHKNYRFPIPLSVYDRDGKEDIINNVSVCFALQMGVTDEKENPVDHSIYDYVFLDDFFECIGMKGIIYHMDKFTKAKMNFVYDSAPQGRERQQEAFERLNDNKVLVVPSYFNPLYTHELDEQMRKTLSIEEYRRQILAM